MCEVCTLPKVYSYELAEKYVLTCPFSRLSCYNMVELHCMKWWNTTFVAVYPTFIFFGPACNNLASQLHFFFLVRGAKGREKYVWTLASILCHKEM